MTMPKRYPAVTVLIVLAAIALSAALVTANANALPTFNTAVGGIGPCDSCHPMASVHPTATHHTGISCGTCHTVSTATPPLPSACGTCHTPTSVVLAKPTHASTGCGTTVGCHGYTGPTPTPTPTTTPTTTPTPTPTPTTPAVTVKSTLALSGLSGGVMKLGKSVTAKGKVTPTSLAGSKITLTVQKKSSGKWMKVKSVKRTISASGAYKWMYKPGKAGTYRMVGKIAKTAAHKAATTPYRAFKVVKKVKVPDYNG